jgi:hypothetical protein
LPSEPRSAKAEDPRAKAPATPNAKDFIFILFSLIFNAVKRRVKINQNAVPTHEGRPKFYKSFPEGNMETEFSENATEKVKICLFFYNYSC